MRRTFLKKILKAGLGFFLISLKDLKASVCRTGSDTAGPFYRRKAPFKTNIAKGYGASGDTLMVKGTVYGSDCSTPLANAEVDVWHASPEGNYDNNSQAFLFRGKVTTNDKGHYEYKTIMPGIYASRPRHIHYKVRHQDHQELTTQLYFSKDQRLNTDAAVISSKGKDRAMPYQKQSDGSYKMTFDIYLG